MMGKKRKRVIGNIVWSKRSHNKDGVNIVFLLDCCLFSVWYGLKKQNIVRKVSSVLTTHRTDHSGTPQNCLLGDFAAFVLLFCKHSLCVCWQWIRWSLITTKPRYNYSQIWWNYQRYTYRFRQQNGIFLRTRALHCPVQILSDSESLNFDFFVLILLLM